MVVVHRPGALALLCRLPDIVGGTPLPIFRAGEFIEPPPKLRRPPLDRIEQPDRAVPGCIIPVWERPAALRHRSRLGVARLDVGGSRCPLARVSPETSQREWSVLRATFSCLSRRQRRSRRYF